MQPTQAGAVSVATSTPAAAISVKTKRSKVVYVGPKVQKTYFDICKKDLIEYIASSTRFPLPGFGIHRPQVWKNRKNWGVTYRVLAEVRQQNPKYKNANKYDIINLKWKAHKLARIGEQLMPVKGYEAAVKPIDITKTSAIKASLPN